MSIKTLPENVWTRIAAGEVVERPASVVKELIENSLDAGATRIKIRLWDGGRLRIVVEDDGCGISFEDLPLALTPHATSKIAAIDDLEAISTLGYRGEALASIAAVSKIEILSRQNNNKNNTGGVIRAAEGKIIEHLAMNCASGTRIQIDDLFGNFPARRKFLKSASGELRRAAVCVREYAVCHPEISFILEHDGREIFLSDGSGDRRRLLSRLWGAEPEIKNINLQSGHTELECWRQARQNIRGNSARSDIMAFVNGRAVNDPVIKGAVSSAAREFSGNWALFFKLDLSLVDVNIHPAKSEVRFRYSGEIFDILRDAAAQLSEAAQFMANNDNIFNFNLNLNKKINAPMPLLASRIQEQNKINFYKYAKSDERGSSAKNNQYDKFNYNKLNNDLNDNVNDSINDIDNININDDVNNDLNNFNDDLNFDPKSFNNNFRDKLRERLSAEKSEKSEKNKIPPAEFMGQIASGYIVFNTPDGLVLMDPHAAHERIKYEQVRAAAQKSSGVQNLLVPVPLPPTLALEIEEFIEILNSAGLEFERNNGILYLKAIPSAAVSAETGKGDKNIDPETLLRASVAALKSGESADSNDILWRAWANVACKAAVKITTEISKDEALALWNDLYKCEQPFLCPHGRPTLLKIGNDELVKHFGRE